MEELKEYSGNIKLRLPKTLHESLVEAAKLEGISLNQYCIYALSEKLAPYMIGKRKLNDDLKRIRKETNIHELDKVLEKVKVLNQKVLILKEAIKDEVKNKLNNKKRLSNQDILDLEYKYPLLIDRFSERSKIDIKIPTIKMVLEPIDNNMKNEKDIENILDEIMVSYNSIVSSKINIDEIDYNFSKNINIKELNSYVIYFLDENLENVNRAINDINDKLEKFKNTNEFTIKYYPIYILEKLF